MLTDLYSEDGDNVFLEIHVTTNQAALCDNHRVSSMTLGCRETRDLLNARETMREIHRPDKRVTTCSGDVCT
jgi:hypothetical protein